MVKDLIRHREEQRRYRAKHREQILAKAREPASREKMKKWKVENPDKLAESARKSRARRKEAHSVYNKAWRLANLEKVLTYNQTYRAEHREASSAYCRKYNAEHREERAICWKIYYISNRDRLLEQGRASIARKKSINTVRHNPEDVYRIVSRAVSSTIPRFMRDDVISSMLLAVLEGELLLENVGKRMKDYLGRYNREYDSFKTLSLDAPMGGTDLKRIDLLEAPAPYEPEEDEEDPDMVMLKGGYSHW